MSPFEKKSEEMSPRPVDLVNDVVISTFNAWGHGSEIKNIISNHTILCPNNLTEL